MWKHRLVGSLTLKRPSSTRRLQHCKLFAVIVFLELYGRVRVKAHKLDLQ